MTLVNALRRALPRGRSLPDDVWNRRHGAIVLLLWAHAAAVPFYARIMGKSAVHSLVESAVLPLFALLASWSKPSRLVRMVAASVGLLSASGILVHLSHGLIEMHFHFFVMVAVVALYQDWAPFLMAIGYVLVHHGITGAVDPQSVFNHPEAWRHPWKWAAIHALFIAGISIACLVSWRLNEIMLDQRRLAEDRLREGSRVVETLNEIGKALAADLDLHSVVQHVTDAATQLTNAAFGAFFYNVTDDAGESYMLYTISGADRRSFDTLGMPRNTPVFDVTFSGRGVLRLDDVTKDERYGTMAPFHGMPPGHLPVRSYLAVPVRSRTDAVIGGLFFGHPEPGQFGEVEERLAVGIASHAAVAIDNASLYDSERRARASAEASRRTLEVMAEASRALSSSLDLERILTSFAYVIAPAIADSCELYLLDAEQALTLAAFYRDPSLSRDDAVEYRPAMDNHDDPVVRALVEHTAVFVEEMTEEQLARAVPDERLRAMIPFRPTSAIAVPLTRRGVVLGVLTVGTNTTSDRRMTRDDVELVEELGRRVAIAVENATLYSAQRTAAETLQHSLLPEQLPDIPGLEMAARYVPGGSGVEVGGDWYDVIPLEDGCLGFAMGDVVGRGVGAASLMGQLRNALRAFAWDGLPPARVLERLNDLLHTTDPHQDAMATLLFAIFDPETGTLRLASAGHPPPLVLSEDGVASYVEGAPGTPLGATNGARYSETLTTLAHGGTLLFYTDGLVEDRAIPLYEGLSGLAGALTRGHELSLDALCDLVLAREPAHEADDDVALLAVRRLRIGERLELHLPARPSILKGLRTTLRRWLHEAGANEVEAYEILVAACEACTNAIQHANVSAGEFDVLAEYNGVVRITVRDRGAWRPSRVQYEGGRGLDIIREFMDQTEIVRSEEGTEVRLSRRLASKGEVPVR